MGTTVKFDYMHKDVCVATVTYDPVTKVGRTVLYSADSYDRPTQSDSPTWDDIMKFFEERSFERGRGDIKKVLKSLDVDFYDPYLIVQKTRGQLWDDFYWIRFEGDTAKYDDIKLRD